MAMKKQGEGWKADRLLLALAAVFSLRVLFLIPA